VVDPSQELQLGGSAFFIFVHQTNVHYSSSKKKKKQTYKETQQNITGINFLKNISTQNLQFCYEFLV